MEAVITRTFCLLLEMASICEVFKGSIVYSWSVLMFYFQADEGEKKEPGGTGGREKLYPHIS